MTASDKTLKELIRGLDGLALLSKWELSLAEDLRAKAESLIEDRGSDENPDLIGEPD